MSDLREGLQAVDEAALKRAVEVLRGPTISQVQRSLRGGGSRQGSVLDRPKGDRLLMQIEAAINDELTGRLQGRVLGLMRSVCDLGSKGGATQRIADEFHQALDFAAELANSSGLYLEGDRLVLNGLVALPSADRKALLQHVSSEDLVRLDTSLPDIASEKDQSALAHIRDPREIETAGMVIEARAARLSERFEACQQAALHPAGRVRAARGQAFLNGVAAAAAALDELLTHCKLHRVSMAPGGGIVRLAAVAGAIGDHGGCGFGQPRSIEAS